MTANNYSDNLILERGDGIWVFTIYNPEGLRCGPYAGKLSTGKDFHTVSTTHEGVIKYIVSIPSQNVSYVEDQRFIYRPRTIE